MYHLLKPVPVHKVFKYSVLAVEHPEREVTHELSFERSEVLNPYDTLDLEVGDHIQTFQITTVVKVDHIKSPNDHFDYRLFAVGTY